MLFYSVAVDIVKLLPRKMLHRYRISPAFPRDTPPWRRPQSPAENTARLTSIPEPWTTAMANTSTMSGEARVELAEHNVSKPSLWSCVYIHVQCTVYTYTVHGPSPFPILLLKIECYVPLASIAYMYISEFSLCWSHECL